MKTICITIIALSVILMNCYAQNVENKTDYFGSSKPNYKPELFGKGIISTQFNELNSSFSPDGNTFLYTIANNSYGNTFYTIFYSKRVNTKWSKPQIASFSGQYSDADPFFSPDGKRFYFISYRPIDKNMKEKNDFDIWFLSYEKGLFGQPQHLGENVNSDKNELYPTVSNNGNLYFSTENGTNGNDLMMSKLIKNVFDKPVSLGDSINTTATEYDAYIAPDENYIIFTSIGQKNWIIQKYTSITPKTNFKLFNAFADKDENPQPTGSEWDYNFSEKNGTTKVSITIYNESLERLDKMIEMGFKQGITISLSQLDILLSTLRC